MRTKTVYTLSPIQKEILEANFRKLWLMDKVHTPFMILVSKIQKVWGLPFSGDRKKARKNIKKFYEQLDKDDNLFFASLEFTQIAPIINAINDLPLPPNNLGDIFVSLLHNQPSQKFRRDIVNLQSRFGFEEFWFYRLIAYIITGNIYAPFEKTSKAFLPKIIPEHIKEDWKIFRLTCRKEAQHKYLKEVIGLSADEIYKSKDSELKKYIPRKLIRTNLTIAQSVFGDRGKDQLSDTDFSKMERRQNEKVRTRLRRFRKYIVGVSEEDSKSLQDLNFSSSVKNGV